VKAIKKSVRLVENTIRLCNDLTHSGEVNFSGGINAMAEQYRLLVESSMPTLSEKEKTAFYCVYNGYIPHPDLSVELNHLHWNISEGYQYDQQVSDLLGSKEKAVAFVDRIKSWTTPEKLAVIYMAKSYWRKGQIAG
jgi:hypothetical protein